MRALEFKPGSLPLSVVVFEVCASKLKLRFSVANHSTLIPVAFESTSAVSRNAVNDASSPAEL